MKKCKQLYEGKAKRVYETEDPNLLIVSYKDDATAFNGLKKGSIAGKGAINNQMSNRLMARLAKAGVPNHFVEELSERDTLVRRVQIVPLEVIVRNRSAGSFSKRYGVEEGIVFAEPTVEYSYKNDALGDPLLNSSHALALGLATAQELETIRRYNPKRLVVLFGSVGGRTKLRRAELGEVVSALADFCIITSDNPDFEPPEDIIADIEKAVAASSCPYVTFVDRREAVRYAIDNARDGDCILFAGKGHEEYQIVNGEYLHYDEREEIMTAAAARLARIK